MQRALELAALGRGCVSPNPMVGCVIVHEGQIIGEGWHQNYGEAHAEVNAVQSVKDPALLKEATIYVSLEPCAHHGKTPPCADMLISHQVKKVVIGAFDTNPLVGGKGIERMRQAGIEVVTDVLEAQSRDLNRRFFTAIEKHRPYIILKWAQTADGFVARKNYDSKWISNEQSRQLVHQWRAQEDAILVGPQTARYDNPRLNVRGIKGQNPLRLLVDRKLSVAGDLHFFDGSQPTLIYNCLKEESNEGLNYVKLDQEDFLLNLLKDLNKRKIQSLIVEGGAGILNAFIAAGLWDEARIFKSANQFEEGISAPKIEGSLMLNQKIGNDLLEIRYSQ